MFDFLGYENFFDWTRWAGQKSAGQKVPKGETVGRTAGVGGAGGGRDGAGTSDWDPECLTKTDSGHITEAETGSLFCPTLRCKCVGNND